VPPFRELTYPDLNYIELSSFFNVIILLSLFSVLFGTKLVKILYKPVVESCVVSRYFISISDYFISAYENTWRAS